MQVRNKMVDTHRRTGTTFFRGGGGGAVAFCLNIFFPASAAKLVQRGGGGAERCNPLGFSKCQYSGKTQHSPSPPSFVSLFSSIR